MAHVHESHDHAHHSSCGHVAIQHRGHVDYLHDGHLHRQEAGARQVTECAIEAGPLNPAACTDGHACQAHDDLHLHGPECGHEQVPHGDHHDFLVAGHLHHVHDGHCDDHGALELS